MSVSDLNKHKGIPKPNKGRKLKYDFPNMEIGGTIDSKSNIYSAAVAWAERNNKDWEFESRKTEKGYTLWRVK